MKLVFVLLVGTLGGQTPAKPLYERMGRYDAIAAIAGEYLKGVRGDPAFARFAGRGADSLRKARQLLQDQLCALAGGPCVYIGREMKTAHAGLGITAAEWEASRKHMAAALDSQNVPAREKQELLALLDAMKADFVEKP